MGDLVRFPLVRHATHPAEDIFALVRSRDELLGRIASSLSAIMDGNGDVKPLHGLSAHLLQLLAQCRGMPHLEASIDELYEAARLFCCTSSSSKPDDRSHPVSLQSAYLRLRHAVMLLQAA